MSASGKSVLFLGDINVDILLSGLESPVKADCEVFCRGFSRVLGGSTSLAAAVFARLGGKASFCGLAGDDDNGQFAKSRLEAAGVDVSLLRVSTSAPTGVTVNLLRGRERSQVTCRGTLSLADETARALNRLDDFCHVHISGPYGMPAFLPRIEGFLSAARAAGKTLSLDTQWDPTEKWPYLDAWLPNLDFLFVNEHEAASITGERDPLKAWERLAGRTAFPVMKLGPEGALVGGKQYPAIDVPVVDTTGAGDSFAAGFLFASLTLGMETSESVKFASAVSAVACTYPGGDSELMTIGAVRKYL